MRYLEEFKQILFNTYNLYFKMQLYHWNINGINFLELHKLFEEHYTEYAQATDQLAEHIRLHNVLLEIDLATIAAQNKLGAALKEQNAKKLLKDTLNSNKQIYSEILALIEKLTTPKEETTKDLLIARMHVHQKNIWLLSALQEGM